MHSMQCQHARMRLPAIACSESSGPLAVHEGEVLRDVVHTSHQVREGSTAPVAANRGARADVHVTSNDHVPRHGGQRMHERRLVYDGDEVLERVDRHGSS